MSFQALYRKYRPQRFGELVGQDHITGAIRNAVREDRIGHAYLFSGPRGNGKTTTARILAKALNCLELGDDGEPCGQCENCVSITAGTFSDLIEMDAASNRGVDDARDLVARISLGLGATSKRKVYLLDEVHMLTKDAANTLLKTLEEPPAHVVFILATTEPEKVLPTIRSRTQHFEFKYLTVDELSGLLASVLADEGIEFEPDALAIIARAAGGSARDSESLLDLVLARGGAVTVALVESALGGAPFELQMTILDALAAEDVAGVLTGIAALLDAAHDPRRIAEGLLSSLRDAFISVAGAGRVGVDEPEEVQTRVRAVGETMGNAALVRALETLGQAIVDMRGTDAADPRLVLEIALVRLARRDAGGSVQALADRIDRLEMRFDQGGAAVVSAPGVVPAPPALPARSAPARTKPAAVRPKATSGEPGDGAAPPPSETEPESVPRGRPAALGALRKAAASKTPSTSDPEPSPAPSSTAAGADVPPDPAVEFSLDDVILAWATVLDSVPKSLRASIMEAQPVRVEGNVIVFGVGRNHIEAVKPKFQKDADAIRQAFIQELGGPPRFKFTQQEWGDGEGPPHRLQAVPDPEPPPEFDDAIDLVDPEELVDAPMSEGPAVDSLARLTDQLGATVVEEQPKS